MSTQLDRMEQNRNELAESYEGLVETGQEIADSEHETIGELSSVTTMDNDLQALLAESHDSVKSEATSDFDSRVESPAETVDSQSEALADEAMDASADASDYASSLSSIEGAADYGKGALSNAERMGEQRSQEYADVAQGAQDAQEDARQKIDGLLSSLDI